MGPSAGENENACCYYLYSVKYNGPWRTCPATTPIHQPMIGRPPKRAQMRSCAMLSCTFPIMWKGKTVLRRSNFFCHLTISRHFRLEIDALCRIFQNCRKCIVRVWWHKPIEWLTFWALSIHNWLTRLKLTPDLSFLQWPRYTEVHYPIWWTCRRPGFFQEIQGLPYKRLQGSATAGGKSVEVTILWDCLESDYDWICRICSM